MKNVKTYQELKKALGTDEQGSGTQCGWIIFNGQKMYVRKHWSYSGGFPAYKNEDMDESIGELFGGKDYFEYCINGVPQLHNGWQPMLDSKLEMRNEN